MQEAKRCGLHRTCDALDFDPFRNATISYAYTANPTD
jgi:hypothetical protein